MAVGSHARGRPGGGSAGEARSENSTSTQSGSAHASHPASWDNYVAAPNTEELVATLPRGNGHTRSRSVKEPKLTLRAPCTHQRQNDVARSSVPGRTHTHTHTHTHALTHARTHASQPRDDSAYHNHHLTAEMTSSQLLKKKRLASTAHQKSPSSPIEPTA